jgi:LmbE family N-acetylglucosaminyl deacetylase
MSVAVLSPHLDDAVLSAWTTLRGGGDVLVVNVFDGVPAPGTLSRWDRVTGAADSSERMRERLAEDRAALALAGVAATSLGLLENEYRAPAPAPDELGGALSAAAGGRDEVWAPAAIGRHPDHVAVREWALGAAREGLGVRLYADLPYAARHGWPAWVNGAEPEPHFSHELWWERDLPRGASLSPEARRLDPGEAELKLRAIAEYRTQFYALDGGPVGLLRNPAVIAHEVSWAVGP